jgi:hypothetical protein
MKHFYNYTYTVNTFFVVLGVPLDICHVCPPPSHTYRGTSTPYSNKHSFESSAHLKADLDSRMHQPSSLTLPHWSQSTEGDPIMQKHLCDLLQWGATSSGCHHHWCFWMQILAKFRTHKKTNAHKSSSYSSGVACEHTCVAIAQRRDRMLLAHWSLRWLPPAALPRGDDSQHSKFCLVLSFMQMESYRDMLGFDFSCLMSPCESHFCAWQATQIAPLFRIPLGAHSTVCFKKFISVC